MVPTAIVVSIQPTALASRLKGRTKARSIAAEAPAAARTESAAAGSSGQQRYAQVALDDRKHGGQHEDVTEIEIHRLGG
jgi:hypothetical protein